MRVRFVPVILALGAVGCPKGPPPDSVRIELPKVVLDATPVRPVVNERRMRQSTPVARGGFTLRAEPPTLATTSADGTLACLKSGDGKVTVEVLGVQATAELRCRLVARIESDELSALDLKKGVVVLGARVVDKAGHELSDVPITVSPTNRDVVSVQDFQVTPLSVGSSTLVLRAGSAERKVDVRVVKSIDFEAQSLRGGRRADIALPQGNFEIEVTFKEPKEVRIDWRGARQCNYHATAATHRSSCLLEEKGGAVVDNPTFLESGDTKIDKSRIVVRQIP